MGEWIELTDARDNSPILIKKSAIASVSPGDDNIVYVYLIGDGEYYYSVNESYDEIKNMLVRRDTIEMKYNDEDKETIEKWIDKLNSIGCQSFKVTPDLYQPTGAYTNEDFNRIVENLGL